MLLGFLYSRCLDNQIFVSLFECSHISLTLEQPALELVRHVQQQDAPTHNAPFRPTRLVDPPYLSLVPLRHPEPPWMGSKHRPQPRFGSHSQPQEQLNTPSTS